MASDKTLKLPLSVDAFRNKWIQEGRQGHLYIPGRPQHAQLSGTVQVALEIEASHVCHLSAEVVMVSDAGVAVQLLPLADGDRDKIEGVVTGQLTYENTFSGIEATTEVVQSGRYQVALRNPQGALITDLTQPVVDQQLHLAQLIRNLVDQRATTLLHLTAEESRQYKLRFYDGRLLYSKKILALDQVSDMLQKEGLLSLTFAKRAIKAAASNSRTVAAELIDGGQVSEEKIVGAVCRKILRSWSKAFFEPGVFETVPFAQPPDPAGCLEFSGDEVAFRGLLQAASVLEISDLSPWMGPHLDVGFGVVGEPDIGYFLNKEEIELWSLLVKGEDTLRFLIKQSPFNKIITGRYLYCWFLLGRIHFG